MYFYGEQNKGGGQKKFRKGINIFSKKGFLRGGQNVAKGGTKNFFLARLRAQIVPPLNKSPRSPLAGGWIKEWRTNKGRKDEFKEGRMNKGKKDEYRYREDEKKKEKKGE